jgi:RNA polymerase sigma-70 factor (ECF subfamily)
MEGDEQVAGVMSILNTLPANQQEVIRLKFQGELSYQEISHITKLSVSNVGFLIHTGLKTIREKSHAGQAQRRAK